MSDPDVKEYTPLHPKLEELAKALHVLHKSIANLFDTVKQETKNPNLKITIDFKTIINNPNSLDDENTLKTTVNGLDFIGLDSKNMAS